MKCTACGSVNPENANFCNQCGHGLPPSPVMPGGGPAIDEKIARIQRYLPQGLVDKILSQKGKIEGERRHVTVLFCDMAGFTQWVNRLGPESAYRLMDQVYETLIHEVYAFEGTVNEMTGDGIMALFGAPIALENAPQRALGSALSIHRKVAEITAPEAGLEPIRMRIGIHTGPVVVGTLGSNMRVEFKAVGNTVNLASRMEGLAEPGSTCVTEETVNLARGLFEFQDLGRKVIKGLREPVAVYRLVGAREDRRHWPAAEFSISSPMIGRDRELNLLELQLMKAVNGTGSIVNIVGEAGLGKTRLVVELKRRDLMKRLALFEGKAISMGRNLSFHLIIDLLKQWVHIQEDDSGAAAFGRLEAAVRRLCAEEMDEVLPFLGTLMGMKLSGRYAERVKGIEGEALEKLIQKSLRDLLARAAKDAPVVLIAEDLHWADASSIAALESLFQLARDHPVVFVNVFRPGYGETGNRIVETVAQRHAEYRVEIAVAPLDERSSEQMLAGLLNSGRRRHEIIDRIVERAEGNPFFIEEVLKSLIDERTVVRQEDRFEIAAGKEAVAIPYTISEVLMARIDRLDEPVRDLVKLTAVIGRSFFRRILSEMPDLTGHLDEKLSHLKNAQLIQERGRMGEVEYVFNHALTQQVAYESILPQKRRELHLRVARAIENAFSDRIQEFYGMLAFHYSQADHPEKTEELLLKAGEEALKTAASNEALFYYREALSRYMAQSGAAAEASKVAMLKKNIALALYNRGQYDEALPFFDGALAHYFGELPRRLLPSATGFIAAALHFLAAIYLPLFKFRKQPSPQDAEAIDLFYKKCLALVIVNPKRFFLESFHLLRRVTRYDLRRLNFGTGIFVSASSLFSFSGISFGLSRRILDFARQQLDREDEKQLILFDILKTQHHYCEGSWAEAAEHDDELARKNLGRGEIWFTTQHYYWHGCLYLFQGRAEAAAAMVARLKEIAGVYMNDHSLFFKFLLNINLLTEYRRLAEAREEIAQALDFIRRAGLNVSLVSIYACKALIHLELGDTEKAAIELQAADERMSGKDKVPVILSNYYRTRCELILKRLEAARDADGTAYFAETRRQALTALKQLRAVSNKAAMHRVECYKLLGRYYWLSGRAARAVKSWQTAIRTGGELGARLELSRVHLEVGRRLSADPARYEALFGISAAAQLEKARAAFEPMGLQWDLNELDRAAAAVPGGR
jgi:class 3 adenylate cyclase/tetratricopeptide (TPR) repeat protein